MDVELLTFKREKKDQDFSEDNKPGFERFLSLIQPDGQKVECSRLTFAAALIGNLLRAAWA